MAIFMPLDNNLPHLSFNNILKFQTPTQIFHQLMHQQEGGVECFESNTNNYFGNPNAKARETHSSNMTDEKHKPVSIQFDLIHPDESCNSTDSDLSVGQEKIDDDKSDQNESETIENRTMNNVMGDGDEDNSSNASSSPYSTSHLTRLHPKDVSENSTQLPLLHANPARLQEEIFRNSQLYAEELVRQQLAAAARLQSISGSKIFPHIDPSGAFKTKQGMVISSNPEEMEPSLTSKLTFQSSIFAPKSLDNNQNGNNNLFCNNKSAINFQNIHSHLSAISQITNNLTSSIKKDDSTSLSSLSRESSQSPSNFQNLKHHHHHQNMIFHTHQNQLHERNLKFSIDNILKADFGRRITEPLLRSSKSKKAARDGKQDKDLFKKFNAPASTKETFTSRDDNLGGPESSPSNQSPSSSEQGKSESGSKGTGSGTVWPAWVFCTRYSDRPSSGRSPRVKRPKKPPSDSSMKSEDEKRPRTAFSGPQLARLKHEFNENRYLTEKRRQQLSGELGLNEAQIKIWFQNKRAKIKKSTGQKNPLALQLMAQGLYNHSTVPLSKEEEELQELQAAN